MLHATTVIYYVHSDSGKLRHSQASCTPPHLGDTPAGSGTMASCLSCPDLVLGLGMSVYIYVQYINDSLGSIMQVMNN